jgi:hypothetical protein
MNLSLINADCWSGDTILFLKGAEAALIFAPILVDVQSPRLGASAKNPTHMVLFTISQRTQVYKTIYQQSRKVGMVLDPTRLFRCARNDIQ